MRDHDVVAGTPRQCAREQAAPRDQGGSTLGAGAAAAEWRARPGGDPVAVERVPGLPLPGAEIELLETAIETRTPAVAAAELHRKQTAASGGARPDRGARQARERSGQVGRDVEAAVAAARHVARRPVADEEDQPPALNGAMPGPR